MRAGFMVALLLQQSLLLALLLAPAVATQPPPSTHALQVNHQIVQRIASPFVDLAAVHQLGTSDPFYREYELHGLEPNSFYEVRLSYIGTLPYSFRVLLLPSPASRSSARQLLDVEKAMFRTDEQARPEGCAAAAAAAGSSDPSACSTPRVRVEALFNGVTDQLDAMQQDILFAIVLEKLLPGGVPFVALKVLVVVAVSLAIGRWWVWPRIGRAVQTESQRLAIHSPDAARADDKTA